jgi:phycoerythrin-associated linker protein
MPNEVIQSIYKQVFGNRHLMELDVNQSLEALFMNGDLTVQGFVTALAQIRNLQKALSRDQTVLTDLLS